MVDRIKTLGSELAGKLRALGKEDQSIESLKEENAELSQFIIECLELLDQQGLSGFEHATVVRSGGITMKFPRTDLYGDFILGANVQISKASTFAQHPGYPNGKGTILSFDPEGHKGWALVDFGKNIQKPLRYGHPEVDNGFSDLILVGGPILRDTEKPIITVSMRGSIFDVVNVMKLECKEGDTVLINPRNHYIVSTTEPISKGVVTTIDEITDSGIIVIVDGRKYLVGHPRKSDTWNPEKGDRVLIDDGFNIVITNLPRPQSIAIASDIKQVAWDDVIGLEDAKREIERVIHELAHKELFDKYDADPAKGILLWGPPGTGKTYLGKATATRLRAELGSDGDLVRGFMYIKGTEILDMYVGEAPRKVREIFAKAEEYFRRTGQKAIIYIDEVESVLVKRGSSRDSGSADSITNAFLTELDGIQNTYAFVIGATNRIDLIDQAAMRGGRFDRKIYVPRPLDVDVAKFFGLELRNVPLSEGMTLEELMKKSAEEYLSEKYTFLDVYFAKEGIDPKDESTPHAERLRRASFKLSHIGSGAMIKTIVNNARGKAIDRDIKAKATSDTASGLMFEDISQAMAEVYQEYRILKHDAEIQEFLKAQNADAVDVKERA